mmetsp:Transcript_7802/g.17609  ORF Transcript_7802/g.17609 Transcript_7802/m.17609 type:complete len:230 (+) Transcript_7802:1091-1780(+)
MPSSIKSCPITSKVWSASFKVPQDKSSVTVSAGTSSHSWERAISTMPSTTSTARTSRQSWSTTGRNKSSSRTRCKCTPRPSSKHSTLPTGRGYTPRASCSSFYSRRVCFYCTITWWRIDRSVRCGWRGRRGISWIACSPRHFGNGCTRFMEMVMMFHNSAGVAITFWSRAVVPWGVRPPWGVRLPRAMPTIMRISLTLATTAGVQCPSCRNKNQVFDEPVPWDPEGRLH